MPCNPNDNTLNPGVFPGIPIPNFGLAISPIQVPLSNFELPDGIPEDILDMINNITAIFPSSEFKPNLDDISNSILSALSSIFNQIAPFLSLYNFFQALLNMILCVIDVLCSLFNPFKLFRALRRLFKRCLPNFLKLFPWLALLAMILAILLLILALIEYVINKILQILNDLIENLKTLSRGLTLQDDDAVTATAIKIAQLLCLIENLFAVFVAIGAIIQIIQALAGITGRSVCGGGGAPTAGDDSECCSSDVCPPFIHDNPDGLIGITGQLIYYNRINTNLEGILGISAIAAAQFNIPPQRFESWQFVNTDTNQIYSFSDIVTPIGDGDIFYPEGVTYNSDTKPKKAPYTLDLTLKDFDPSPFIDDDTLPSRDFKITDIIVYKKPYIGVYNQVNQLETANSTGTLGLLGGLAYHKITEDSEYVPYLVNGVQATLETLIHRSATSGQLPIFDDGYFIDDAEFVLNIHHEVLIGENLITVGCHPELFLERVIANTVVETNGFDAIAVRLPPVRSGDTGTEFLPDPLGTHACLLAAMSKFRANINEESALEFQAETIACLEEFKRQTSESYCNILRAGVSIFDSTVEIDTNMQFITRPIIATVTLKDPNGTNIGTNINAECVASIEDLLDGYVTFGEITDFQYDGYGLFTAEITSDQSGTGSLTVSFDDQTFKRVLNQDNDDVTSSIEDIILDYEFISTTVVSKTSGASEAETGIRRDNTDVSKDRTD